MNPSQKFWKRILSLLALTVVILSAVQPAVDVGAQAQVQGQTPDGPQQILANDPKRTEQLVQTLRPARTDEFPAPAERPLFSALDCSRFEQTFNLRLPPWQEALQRCMEA